MSEQVLSSGVENAMEIAVRVMSTVLDRILVQFEVPALLTFSAFSFYALFLPSSGLDCETARVADRVLTCIVSSGGRFCRNRLRFHPIIER